MPLYVLGLMGVTRRLSHFEDPSLRIWFMIAAFGAVLILGGIIAFVGQVAVSIMRRDELRDMTGDPWNGRTLEWSTASPPPDYNFAFTPLVREPDAWWHMKSRGFIRPLAGFRPIHMPANTAAGVVLAAISTVMGMSLIWQIWWLAILSVAGIIAVAIARSFYEAPDHSIAIEEVTSVEFARIEIERKAA